ncbi:MAG: glycine zipper 2TM domain-containing protein [Planctomycetales bacterium]|nr:glycine zipper 2TM domain-containing protein [Planctomycetales bacterium]
MSRLVLISALVASVFVSGSSAFAQNRTGEGIAIGGVTGAIAGGIIGKQNHETPEGALIGGAIGALAGGLIGRSQDDAIARENYYRQQAYQQQQVQLQAAVSSAEVVQMARSGVGDGLIINHINSRGVARRLETRDIISLHQQGVTEAVIDAMQRAPIAGTVQPQTRTIVREVVPSPVIVRREYVVPRYAPPRASIYIGTGRPAPRYHYHRHSVGHHW